MSSAYTITLRFVLRAQIRLLSFGNETNASNAGEKGFTITGFNETPLPNRRLPRAVKPLRHPSNPDSWLTPYAFLPERWLLDKDHPLQPRGAFRALEYGPHDYIGEEPGDAADKAAPDSDGEGV